MKHRVGTLAAVVALVTLTAPAFAHHALQSQYDTNKRGEFTGVLTRFAMINPHVRWFFDVKKPDGTIEKWEVTAGGPASIKANGLAREFKTGETFKVTYAPARDGSKLGRAVTFTFPNGRVITTYHEDPSNPNDL